MSGKTWRLSALDTLFFRESRPMESVGGSELSSLFPPPARTLAGAIRTTLAESSEKELGWEAYAEDEHHPLRQTIGYGDDLGPLSMRGPWIVYRKNRLYPAPGNLVGEKKVYEAENCKQVCVTLLGFMQPGRPCRCDLGKNVRFASLPSAVSDDVRPLSGEFWLTSEGFVSVLNGEAPKVDQVIHQDDLYADEARIGIGRDNQLRSVKEGLLYQTRHIRLKNSVCIEMDVQGGPEPFPVTPSLLRLGGEGRMVDVKVTNQTEGEMTPSAPKPKGNEHGLIIYLLTPALMNSSWQPLSGAEKNESEHLTTWKGEINGVALTLHSTIAGTAHREGGWDMVQRKPRVMKSLIPAGTAFYCTVNQVSIAQAIKELHGSQIGEEQALGRGQIAVGLWLKDH